MDKNKVHHNFLKRSMMGMTNRLLAIFIGLSVLVCLVIISVAVFSMERVGQFAESSSISLGEVAAIDSAAALNHIGTTMIRQKAVDVARQVEIFVAARPGIQNRQLIDDPAFRSIAVQSVGKTGYTLLYEKKTAIMLLHTNPELINFDMRKWKEKLPAFWNIFELSLDGVATSGYYEWEELNGSKQQKFMYVVPVEGTNYMVGATTYVDEFLQPSRQIETTIIAASQETSRYIQQQKDVMQSVFLGVILFMLLIIFLLAYFLARTVSKPILALTEGSRALGRGQLDFRVVVRTGDELEELANQFNTMAGALKDSYNTLEQKVEDRTRAERRRSEELHAINEVGRKISSILSLDELLSYVVTSLRDTFQYDNVNILLVDPDTGVLVLKASATKDNESIRTGSLLKVKGGIAGWVAAHGESLLVNDVRKDPRYFYVPEFAATLSELAVPIKVAQDIKGVLDLESKSLNAFDELDLSTAQTLADQLAIAIENARLYHEIRDVAVLEERNRMAREIHDTLAQGFTGIILQIEAAIRAIGNESRLRGHLDDARVLARESLNEARRSVWALRPKALEQLPLEQAIIVATEKFEKETEIDVQATIHGDKLSLPPDTEVGLLRILQEALNNIKKHAHAGYVVVQLTYKKESVNLLVQDNGIGFDQESVRKGSFGLIGMRERVKLLGGSLLVQSEKGKGTLVEATIQVK